MSNADRIVLALRKHGALTDGALRTMTGVQSHQQVNQICRRLEQQGVLRRDQGPEGRIVNVLADTTTTPQPDSLASEHSVLTDHPMFVIPCSSSKAIGGENRLTGPSVLETLPDDLARRLSNARAALRGRAHVDDSLLAPAWQRYTGTFYGTTSSSLEQLIEAKAPVVILSGAYGLLLADEPVGWYDRAFRRADWPQGLLEACLLTVGQRLGVRHILAFCARTTAYAALIRRAQWREAGLQAVLVSPHMGGRGGAQVLVPRAAGEALNHAVQNELSAEWLSSEGVLVRTEPVP